MASTTFIHTSDLQIGMEYWFLGSEALARFKDAHLESITKLGALAEETGAEFIVVAGDVFHYNSLGRQMIGRARERLEKLPVPIFLLPGNHDPLTADSAFFRLVDFESEETNVHVFRDGEPTRVPGTSQVEVVGAPYLTKHVNRDLVSQALEPLEPTDNIRVMVGHGQVESRSSEDAPDLIDLPAVEAAIREGTIDYLALGDTHSTASLSQTGAVWFSGAPEKTDYREVPSGGGESDSGNALVVTIDKPGAASEEAPGTQASGAHTPGTQTTGQATVRVETRALGEWTFEAVDMDVNTSSDVDAFLDTLKAYPHKDRTAVKYSLRGSLGLNDLARLEREISELTPIFASLRTRDRLHDLHLAPDAEELAALDVRGYAADALEELVGSLEMDETAQDAANLLFRLSSQDGK